MRRPDDTSSGDTDAGDTDAGDTNAADTNAGDTDGGETVFAGSPSGDLISGRYELGKLLGRGGMGEVRAARDVTLGRDVAVKLLHPGLAGDERISRRFQHEAHAAARLTHPNVVRVYDAGEDDGRPFIVMERLRGGTLADEIARGPMSEVRVRMIGVQVLDALAAAHKHGVLHRDVKPSNILLGPDRSVRVGDFGIAKTDLATDATTTGTVVGTLGYLAPERLHGQPATAASDLYSVGVLLYEALTGTRPFTGDNPVAVLTAVQRADPPSIEQLRPDVDPSMGRIIRRAMAVQPGARFASAEEFAAELRATPSRRSSSPDATAAMPSPTAVMETVPPAVAPTAVPAGPPTPPHIRLPAPPPRPPAPAAPRPTADARRRPSAARIGLVLLLLAAIGFAVGLGIGVVLRDDEPSTPGGAETGQRSDDPVEQALRDLEEAVTP